MCLPGINIFHAGIAIICSAAVKSSYSYTLLMVRLDFVALYNRTICYLIKQFFSRLVVESFCLIREWENNSSCLYNIH